MTRRFIALGLVVALLGIAAAAPAFAGKKKKSPAPVPIATSLFLHGTERFGEMELPQTWTEADWLDMDKEAPTGGEAKSIGVTNYILGPNVSCSGNGLVPTWEGALTGTVTGDVKATLHTMATPGAQIAVELYPDGGGGCNSGTTMEYVEPAAEQLVTLPAGQGKVEVTFPGVNFPVMSKLVMMISIAPPLATSPRFINSPHQVRIFYDSEAQASGLQLNCLPNAGATACTP